MNEIREIENTNIEDMIYEIRGKQVMLDTKISATKWHKIKWWSCLNFKISIKQQFLLGNLIGNLLGKY